MADDRDEIRARVDIVELVSQRVALKRSGKYFTGLCPFHQDKNPSFSVDPATGRYRCWSCQAAGDIFTWVMQTENLDFAEAIRELADRAGIKLQKKAGVLDRNEKELRRAAMTEALAFFRESLGSSSEARDYCSNRGIDAPTLETWEIGYAPNAGEALAVRLKRKGFPLVDCRALFLVEEDASGGFYDRFRGRLMFPIRDERGDLVAFGGRLLGDGHPKYINSSDTPLYRKSRVLYGMNKARDGMSKTKKAVLVEGYLDTIACHRSGLETAVASLGTAFSSEQAKLLKRWVQHVTILYDGDSAGRKAAEPAIGILEGEEISINVALLGEGQDPDTMLRSSGPDAVRETVSRAVSPTAFRLSALEAMSDVSSPGFWKEAADLLAKCTDRLEVEQHKQRLAPMYPGIRDPLAASAAFNQMIESRRVHEAPGHRTRKSSVKAAPEYIPFQEPLQSAEILLFAAFCDEKLRPKAWTQIEEDPEMLATGLGQSLANAVLDAFPLSPPEGPAVKWIHIVEPDSMRTTLSDLPHDLRAFQVNEEALRDAIEDLKNKAEARGLRASRRSESTAEDRQEVLKKIRQRHEAIAAASDSGADDPFA